MTLAPKASMHEDKLGTFHPAMSTAGNLEIEKHVSRGFSIKSHSAFLQIHSCFFLTKNAKLFLSWDGNGASHQHADVLSIQGRKFIRNPWCKSHSSPAWRCGRSVKWFYPSLMKPDTVLPTLQTTSSGQLSLPVVFNLYFSLPGPGSFRSPLSCFTAKSLSHSQVFRSVNCKTNEVRLNVCVPKPSK